MRVSLLARAIARKNKVWLEVPLPQMMLVAAEVIE
jgi:hypothetical protein